MPLKYTYLVLILICFSGWLAMFILRKDLRRKILYLSALGILAGPVSQIWFLEDYWTPQYTLGRFGMLEDMLFGLTAFGFTGAIVNCLTNTKSEKIVVPPQHIGKA